MSEQLIPFGNVDETDTLGSTLHHASKHGNKRALKKVLDKGIDIDYPNDEGQSPLFCACLCGNGSVVEYLLSAGADPNEKSNSGLTPVHAASYSGHVKVLMKLLSEGGDLRLHDHQGRSVKDWAMLHSTPKKRMKMLEFLDKTRLFAMSSSGQDLLTRKASSKTLHKAHHRRNTVTKIIRDRIGRPSIHNKLEKMATDHHSVGFGQVYSNSAEKAGFISAIPLVSESNLKHDPDGETYNNGAFCVMESMWWNYTEVTIKRLHRELDPFQGGVVDLLINEIQHIGKLRHPHILTLMGVCQTNNLDGLVVIYERIGQGSLYNYLHQKMERLPSQMIKDIAVQMCNAIIFLHLQGLVHCAITSHAISVVSPNMYKLGNFEYMLEGAKCDLGKKNAVATNTSENAVYNWMAPEIMMNLPPSCFCDMYSYCVVIWEIFHGQVPWEGHCSEGIKAQYHKGNKLKLGHGQIPEYYKEFMDYGLELDPNYRKLSFLHVRDLLLTAPKDIKQYMRAHFQHLLRSNPPSSTPVRDDLAPRPGTNMEAGPSDRKHDSRPVSGADRIRSKDEEKKRQKKKYRSNMENEDYVISKKGYNDNCQLRGKSETPIRMERKSYKQEAQRVYDETSPEEEIFLPNRRDKKFERNRFTIETGNADDNAYHYTVQMKKDNHEGKQPEKQVEFSPIKQHYKTVPVVELSTSDDEGNTCTEVTDDVTQTTSSDNQQYARGRSLERKTSSLGNFSYLNLGNHTKTRCAAAKPACHVQSELVSEEYSTAGKLTTAGSLYALYNEHSPTLPMGQLEHREYQRYATLPTNKEPKQPSIKADPRWFGGRGSVRDLAKVFQQQIQHHHNYQSVVDGTVNKNHSNEAQLNGETDSNKYQGHDKYHHLVYDVDDDSSSVYTTSSLNDQLDVKRSEESSSTESDHISQWVEHELRKIKRNLSKEIAVRESQKDIAISPDLFDKSTNQSESPAHSYNLAISESSTTQTTNSSSDSNQAGGDKERFCGTDFSYFDDEIYTDEPRGKPTRTYNDHDDVNYTDEPRGKPTMSYDDSDNVIATASPVKTALPMSTVLKETPTKERKNKGTVEINEEVSTKCSSGNKKKRTSKIPTSKSIVSGMSQNKDAAYANIVTIKSSLDDAGVHQITHQMKNLKTGGTKTVFNDKVNAKKVVTTFRAAR